MATKDALAGNVQRNQAPGPPSGSAPSAQALPPSQCSHIIPGSEQVSWRLTLCQGNTGRHPSALRALSPAPHCRDLATWKATGAGNWTQRAGPRGVLSSRGGFKAEACPGRSMIDQGNTGEWGTEGRETRGVQEA